MSPEKSALEALRIDRTQPTRTHSLAWIPMGVLALLALLLAGGWWLTRPAAAEIRTAAAQPITLAGQKTVLNASGYVTARRQATVSSKVTGKVVEVLIEEGMKVTNGQVLARLDSSNIQASLHLAQAQLESARSALGEIQVRLAEAQAELRRITDLAQTQISSRADLDHAEAEFHSLKARLDRQQADVLVAEREVALWQQQMEDTVIRAPFAGVVVSKNAQPGEMISPISAGGGFTRTGICTIVDMDSLEIEVDVNESYINRVEPDQSVKATLDAYPDWQIPAHVLAIIPTADRQKATVKVRVGFAKLDRRILPDMGIKVAFQDADNGAKSERGVTIPKSAVRRQNGLDQVLVIQEGRARCRTVTLGGFRSDEVIVLAGLAAGDRVVVEGPEKLAEGDRVQERK